MHALRYTDPHSGRVIRIEINQHGEGTRRFYTFRLREAGLQSGTAFRFYLDALRAALSAARAECRKPTH
jgi:hypothetical protein